MVVWEFMQSGVSIVKVRKYLECLAEICRRAAKIELKKHDFRADKSVLCTVSLTGQMWCRESFEMTPVRLLRTLSTSEGVKRAVMNVFGTNSMKIRISTALTRCG